MRYFTPMNSNKKSLNTVLNSFQTLVDVIKQNEAVAQNNKTPTSPLGGCHAVTGEGKSYERPSLEFLSSRSFANKFFSPRGEMSSLPPLGEDVRRTGEGKKKAAFTLAEVLITLGIIGIVAAMTIPSLIHNQQKKVLENRLKEDYSILQQVMRFNEYDDLYLDTNIPDNITGATNWFKTYLAPHLKYAQVCYDAAGCWQSKMNTRQLNGNVANSNRLGVGIGSGIITVRLTNGSNLCIDGFNASDMKNGFGINSTTSGIIVYIDANGDGGPNVIGKDIFVLGFTEEGLVPAGQDVTNEKVDASCKKGGNGYFCLKKIKDNGWEIPYDVWKMKV